MTRRQLLTAQILFVVYLMVVAWLCFGRFDSTPDVPMTLWGIPTDKVVHFLMFLPFPVLAFLAFDRFTERFWPSVFWTSVSFLAGCAFAAATEFIQDRLLPWRTGDSNDFLADFLALALSSVVVLILDISKQKK